MHIECNRASLEGIFGRWLVLLLFLFSPSLCAAADSYRIAPGDAISVQVYGEPDLTLNNLPIPQNGMISYPLIGEIAAAGLTATELAEEIAGKLRGGYLLRPQVTVSLTAYRPIYVGGSVIEPGQKTYAAGMDVERVLALSGGLTDEANSSDITIQRSVDGVKQAFPAELGSSVLPGDILTIGKSESSNLYIYLHGEVRSPGRYKYSKGITVEKAVVIAGGFGVRASKRKISITRGEPPEKIKRVPLGEELQPGDIINVGMSLF